MKLFKKLAKRLKDQQGVTLIELLAVIVILGIIAAIGIPAVLNNRNEARASVAQSNAVLLEQAAKNHILKNHTFSASDIDPAADETVFDMQLLFEEAGIEVPDGVTPVGVNFDYDGYTYTIEEDTGDFTVQEATVVETE